MKLIPTDSTLFFSRQDPDDPRLGDWAKPWRAGEPLSADAFVIAGYPDDEGIRINGGRPGAAQAPKAVRKPLYKMTPSLFSEKAIQIFDAGDFDPTAGELGQRHEAGTKLATEVLSKGAKWITIGGGHDYGFADADAFLSSTRSMRPIVFNFDAHLDVRPTTKGLSSGTPFFRMLEKHRDFDFCEIGIQAHCNSKKHVEWLEARGAKVITQEEVLASGTSLRDFTIKSLGDDLLKRRPAFISVDIDGFSSTVAPGCSQSWATGFMPNEFFPLFELLLSRFDVRALGIYEVSPPLDQDDRTSKLAAQIIHQFMFGEVNV
ncbi:MAG: formimidoylglutamase [Bdellovibrionota bacterium]